MRTETYMKKNGYIYGVSMKDGQAVYAVKFDDMDEAQTWLYTEEYDFRDRELCSKTRAKELAGKNMVDEAETFKLYW